MTTYYFPDEPFNPNRHLIFTTSLVVTAMAMALITCDLGTVFELIGATSAAALAYIFPPLCYIKLSSASRKAKIPAFICITFGFVVMGVSLIQAVAKMIRSKFGHVSSRCHSWLIWNIWQLSCYRWRWSSYVQCHLTKEYPHICRIYSRLAFHNIAYHAFVAFITPHVLSSCWYLQDMNLN